jgi:glyoxylase-like metal-dependent hydrolase (beta-lactamase superfamily II)
MIIEQIYTGCLSQGAYYIESNGDAAIIDPLREVAPYIEKAKKNKAAIKYIFETHFHADFVSGHVTLAKETGATIVYGPEAKTSYNSLIAKDHQEFKIGNITLTVLHTPGHTMESTTYLLRDQNEKEIAIFSGDTLFLGDVGRPDLAQKAANISQEELAGILYESLWEKIMPLPDDVLIYPAHGAGSACGKNLSKETVGTLGEQKRKNYALREDMTKEEFISEVTKDLLPAPKYFPLNVKMNMEGYEHINTVLESGAKSLSLNEFEAIANENEAIVLDVRNQNEFAKGHIPKSIFIGIDGGFAPWAGSIIGDISQPILLITPKGREKETVIRLARVGFDNTLGFLEGGTEIWDKAGKNLDSVNSVDTDILKQLMERDNIKIFDVRKPQEYQSEHVTNAFSTPLDFINDHLSEFPSNLPFYVHCAGGYRSMITASILKRMEIHNIIDIKGGFTKIKRTGIEVSK